MDLLAETSMTACKPIDTPIDSNHRFTVDMRERIIDAGKYQRLVAVVFILLSPDPTLLMLLVL